ncbi:acyl-CoA N-acyltransferase [Xylariaceae sp. FL0016]|nr:acyl-CoA N-acyltransferase [Xylariaceae sp. FL0016]
MPMPAFDALEGYTGPRGVRGGTERYWVAVQRLFVDPEMQGGGVGRGLLDEALKRARQEGFRGVWLMVWTGATVARGLYKRAGFEEIGEDGIAVGSSTLLAKVMARGL